jgi:ABC-type transport system involved in multi-copper enzyme maturation permease subunit
MKTAHRPVAKIAKYTVLDEIRQRSLVIMVIVGAVFVLLVRGCYHGNYMVNGQVLDAAAVVGAVSKTAFHAATVVVMLLAALLSMRAFRRDRDGGMQSSILSKPITRQQYALGKVAGLWALSAAFMLVLQAIVFLIAAVSMKVVMPGFLPASLLASLNLLFVVVAVLLFSLFMPEIAAFLSIMGIAVVGLVIDGMNALNQSQMVQTIGGWSPTDLSSGKAFYYVWPKLLGMQYFASSFINAEGSRGLWSTYPLFNILFYCLALGALLFWRFAKEEIV